MNSMNIDSIAAELAKMLPLFSQKLIKPFEQLAKSRISPMQFHVLFMLEEKGGLSMTQLSNILLTSKQQMTPIVDKLAALGYADRRHDESDRRIVRIALSPAGRAFLTEQQTGVFEMLKAKLQNLNEEDLDMLYRDFAEIGVIIGKLP